MAIYNIELIQELIQSESEKSNILKIGFGDPASNDEIVKEVNTLLEDMTSKAMGKLLKINGAASLPVAMVLSHAFAHTVPAIACFDPKLGRYVVSITHDPKYPLGMLVD